MPAEAHEKNGSILKGTHFEPPTLSESKVGGSEITWALGTTSINDCEMDTKWF